MAFSRSRKFRGASTLTWFISQRRRRRHAAKPDVHDVGLVVQIDEQQHVPAWSQARFGDVPEHPRRESCDVEPQHAEGVTEQQVLLETVAAPAAADQFLLQRRGIEPNRPALDTFLRYSYEQGLCPRRVEVDELFFPATHRTARK